MDKPHILVTAKLVDSIALETANALSWDHLINMKGVHRSLEKAESDCDMIEGLFLWYMHHRRGGCRGNVPAWVPDQCKLLQKKVEAWQRQAEPEAGVLSGRLLRLPDRHAGSGD